MISCILTLRKRSHITLPQKGMGDFYMRTVAYGKRGRVAKMITNLFLNIYILTMVTLLYLKYKKIEGKGTEQLYNKIA